MKVKFQIFKTEHYHCFLHMLLLFFLLLLFLCKMRRSYLLRGSRQLHSHDAVMRWNHGANLHLNGQIRFVSRRGGGRVGTLSLIMVTDWLDSHSPLGKQCRGHVRAICKCAYRQGLQFPQFNTTPASVFVLLCRCFKLNGKAQGCKAVSYEQCNEAKLTEKDNNMSLSPLLLSALNGYLTLVEETLLQALLCIQNGCTPLKAGT